MAMGLRRLPRLSVESRGVEGLLRRMHFEQSLPRPARELSMQGLADELLVTIARAPHTIARPARHGAARVYDLVAQMEHRFFQPLSLDAAAASARLSRRRFTSLFRQITGHSYHDRLLTLRVGHAQHLLRITDDSVTTIAFACGFNDLSTFYRAFTRRVGCTPLQYRDSAREPSVPA